MMQGREDSKLRRVQFRPCIDLRGGKVTQIVGATLKDNEKGGTEAVTNFESKKGAAYFAQMYKKDRLKGGHVIMLGPGNEEAALEALRAYPGGLHVGGGITPENAQKYLDAGASHVIVTSYVFKNGEIKLDKLKELVDTVGKERLVLDLSCRRLMKGGASKGFYVVTDRWQKFTNYEINEENIMMLAKYCSEFLVHGVDKEGKRSGIETELVSFLGSVSPIPVTYAGGIRSLQDVQIVSDIGNGRVDFTIGSALDIFGGDLPYKDVVEKYGPDEEEEEEVEGTANRNVASGATSQTCTTCASSIGIPCTLI